MTNNFKHRIPLMEDALLPVRRGFEKNNHQNESFYNSGNSIEGTRNLRVDWELSYKDENELQEILDGDSKRFDAMYSILAQDLADIMVNGNVENYSDPFLLILNGELVSGKEATKVLIPRAILYREVKPKKHSVEYTIFLKFGLTF